MGNNSIKFYGIIRPFFLIPTAMTAFLMWMVPVSALGKVIHVNANAGPNGNGSGKAPFATIADAVNAASELGGDTVLVAPGIYPITSTLKIEKPLILRGSNLMLHDENGWPTGEISPGTVTRLVDAGLAGNSPIIRVGRDDLQILKGVTVANLSLVGGFDSVDIFRTQDFIFKDCHITGSRFIGVYSALSSGTMSGNFITDVAASGIIVGAGNNGSPAQVTVLGNRSVDNRLGGFLANGSGTFVPEFADELDVVVRGNDFSDNFRNAVTGFGIRIFVIRRDLGELDQQETGNVRAFIQGNRIVNNTTGITIDAGFPYRTVGGVCDTREYSGDLTITLRGNELSGSLRAPGLITFTRHLSAINQTTLNAWQYLHDSTFRIEDPEEILAGFQLDHPEHDPFPFVGSGNCPEDQSNEELGNTLIYNGVEVDFGRNF